MTLGEVIALLASADDWSMIFARPPWTEESEARLDAATVDGYEPFCLVSDAKEKVRPYAEDPLSMQVARVVAYAERLRDERSSAVTTTRTFAFEGRPVGYFEHTIPSGPGRHRFMPYRGQGHLRLIGELENNRIARCSLPDGTFLVVLGIPEPGVVELGEVGRAKDLVRTDR